MHTGGVRKKERTTYKHPKKLRKNKKKRTTLLVPEPRSQRRKRDQESTARANENMNEAAICCGGPAEGCGGLAIVGFSEAGGSGGSITSAASRTGSGARAGGSAIGAKAPNRPPGRTGTIQFGILSPSFKQLFPAQVQRSSDELKLYRLRKNFIASGLKIS